MKLQVSRFHIEHGERRSPTHCALALAITEAVPPPPGRRWCVNNHPSGVMAFLSRTGRERTPTDSNEPCRVRLSYLCTRFARRFDRGEPVEPFMFTFPYEKEFRRIGLPLTPEEAFLT